MLGRSKDPKFWSYWILGQGTPPSIETNGRSFPVKILVKNGHLNQEKQILKRHDFLVKIMQDLLKVSLKNLH